MEQQLLCDLVYNVFPPITAKNPWLVAQNLDAEEDGQFFYNLNDQLANYHSRIPELLRKRIRGCFHGWVILSNHPHNSNLTLSLWNPNTSKIICLPPLILKDGDYESIRECCLSATLDDPRSILLLTRTNKPTFVFIRLNCKKNKLRWIEMSYDKQLKRITSRDGLVLHSLTCCNGKVYALNADNGIATFVINVDILVKDREVLIKLSLFGMCPYAKICCFSWLYYLKGSGTELFYIEIVFHDKTQKTPGGVYVFKMDMTSIKRCEEMEVFKGLDMTYMSWEDYMCNLYDDLEMTSNLWENMVDFKDTIIFLDISRDYLIFYSSTIASIFGGFIHIRGKTDEIIYSYHVKKRTISLSSMPSPVLPTSNVFLWECGLEVDYGEAKCTVDLKLDEEEKNHEIVGRSVTDEEVELNESHLLNLPFPILESIMELCAPVEYMKFRATCRLCCLAAPLIQRGKQTELNKLQTYSLVSPWLAVVDINEGVLTFTDPLFGGSYFMNNTKVLFDDHRTFIEDEKILCSRFGWLLFHHKDLAGLVFFNPFSSELRKIPDIDCYIRTACFSAPPTSPDCLVVGFSSNGIGYEWRVSILFVARESCWRTFSLGNDHRTLHFPTFKDGDLFAVGEEGKLLVFKDFGEENYSWKLFEAQVPRSCCKFLAKYYLMKCDQHILLVVVGEFGKPVELFKWNDATEHWEKINSLGRHAIYIDGTTCICIEAKIREMENKIYFPRLHSGNGKIMFYSLETSMYHTFNGKNIDGNFKNFIGTDSHHNSYAWIEPSWS